jgi:hypothetical protein
MASVARRVVYQPAVPAKRCYLAEVLLWHAFGRFPQEMRLPGMIDWRFSKEARDSCDAPHPGGFVFSPAECEYASLAPDPLGAARAQGSKLNRPEEYLPLLAFAEFARGNDSPEYKALTYDYERSKKLHENFGEWQEVFDGYVDRFKVEILALLQSGKWIAYGRKLPYVDRNTVYDYLRYKRTTLDDLDAAEIPQEHWVSRCINWKESSLTSSQHAYIWITMKTSKVLAAFPPETKLQDHPTGELPNGAYVAHATFLPNAEHSKKRGRPHKQWDLFHVEVCRKILDGSMPPKREAAIAHFQEWFERTFKDGRGDSSIGSRLKLYDDQGLMGHKKSKS